MTTDAERHHDIAEACKVVLVAAVDGNLEKVADAVDNVGEAYGNRGVYALCRGVVDAAIKASGMREKGMATAGPDGMWGMQLQTPDGAVLDPTGRTDTHEKAAIFVGRFFTAILNGDGTMAVSLFFSPVEAEDEEQLVANVWNLIGLAGAMIRDAMAGAN